MSKTKVSTVSTVKLNETPVTIERGIEIPPLRSKRVKYPFDLMEPGDSFVISRPAQKASVTVNYWKRKLEEKNPNIAFTVRPIDENSARVWRIDGLKLATK